MLISCIGIPSLLSEVFISTVFCPQCVGRHYQVLYPVVLQFQYQCSFCNLPMCHLRFFTYVITEHCFTLELIHTCNNLLFTVPCIYKIGLHLLAQVIKKSPPCPLKKVNKYPLRNVIYSPI